MKTSKTLFKRNVSVLMTFLLMLSLIPLSVFRPFAEELSGSEEILPEVSTCIDTGATITLKDENENGYYDIGNADEFYAFAELVNNGNVGMNAELTDNIVVNDSEMSEGSTSARVWIPIGKSSAYNGIFNGNNKKVFGLYFNNETSSNVGLFGSIGANGKIKNIGVINSYLKGRNSVGGVAGSNGGGEIINCYNIGTISGLGNYIGGIVGNNGGGKIANCYNTGTVSGIDEVGGVVGRSYSNTSIIINCYNAGAVSGVNSIGGVVGSNLYGKITNCYNIGRVIGTFNYIGDIGGYNYKTITNCYYLKMDYSNGGVGYTVNGGKSSTQAKTMKEFKSGEIAYLLQGEQTEEIWGQNIGTDDYPTFDGNKVYMSENSNGEVIYSNINPNTETTIESTVLTESTVATADSSVITEPTEVNTGSSVVTDSTETTTESVGITEPTEVNTESSVATYPTEATTVSTVVTHPTEITTESAVVTEPTEVTAESSATTESTEVTTESAVITEPSESTSPSESVMASTDATEKPSESISSTELSTSGTEKPTASTEPSTPDETKPSEPIAEYLLGDVNGDGKVNIKDATQIQKFAAKLAELTEDEILRADVNGDSKVNVKDATVIQKYVAKLETGFLVGEPIVLKENE